MDRPTRVNLALGSGGARGYAHLGVLQVLDERGIEVVGVAGSSMGALVGAVLAAGRVDEYTEWVLGLTQLDVVRLADLKLSAPGAIRADKVLARVRDLLDDACIEDLPIPYTAVATDLLARKEVWFQRGPIVTAIRASIAIPGVITPVMHNGRLLVDGGVMDPVPIAPTAAVRADATIAVSLGGDPRGAPAGGHVQDTAADEPVDDGPGRLRRSATNLRDRDAVRALLGRFGGGLEHAVDVDALAGELAPEGGEDDHDPAQDRSGGEDVFEALPAGLGKLDVMNQSLEVMQSVLTRYRLAGFPPDVLISVPRDACRSLDFHRAAEMIALGRTLAEEALDRSGIPGLAGRAEPPGPPDPGDAPTDDA